MFPTQSVAHSAAMLSLVFFLGRCDPSVLPAASSSPSDFRNSSFSEPGNIIPSAESGSIIPSVIDLEGIPANWDDCVRKGRSIYYGWETAPLQGRTYGRLPIPLSHDIPSRGVSGTQEALLKKFASLGDWWQFYGYDYLDPSMTSLGPAWVGDVKDAHFGSKVNPRTGVLFLSKWPHDPEAGDDSSDVEIFWAMWKDAVSRMRERQRERHIKVQLQDLDRIIIFPIDEPSTSGLLLAALEGRRGSNWVVPNPNDESQTKFWALLGSPVGSVIQSLLTENKGLLKGRRVRMIVAFSDQSFNGAKTHNADGPSIYEHHRPDGFVQVGLLFQLTKPTLGDGDC